MQKMHSRAARGELLRGKEALGSSLLLADTQFGLVQISCEVVGGTIRGVVSKFSTAREEFRANAHGKK